MELERNIGKSDIRVAVNGTSLGEMGIRVLKRSDLEVVGEHTNLPEGEIVIVERELVAPNIEQVVLDVTKAPSLRGEQYRSRRTVQVNSKGIGSQTVSPDQKLEVALNPSSLRRARRARPPRNSTTWW